jgi:hypothetical protein
MVSDSILTNQSSEYSYVVGLFYDVTNSFLRKKEQNVGGSKFPEPCWCKVFLSPYLLIDHSYNYK